MTKRELRKSVKRSILDGKSKQEVFQELKETSKLPTEDLAKFACAQFNLKNKDLALTRKPTFVVNDKMKIGLGWHILKSENNSQIFWHNGGTGGYSTSMAINIESKTAVIILSNVSAFNPEMKKIDNLCFELINKLIKKTSANIGLAICRV